MNTFTIEANLIDVVNREIYPARIVVKGEIIYKIKRIQTAPDLYILPGFVDSHIHIESSMVTPVEFSKAAIRHGTVATVSDPHEIANVLGMGGVEFMIQNASYTPLKILFGAPSCVPATSFESAGAKITSSDIKELLESRMVGYLSEMMNYPGVVHDDPEVSEKIRIAKQLGVPIDGHAPGLHGEALAKYAGAGISTDHECFTMEEAREKISLGMKIQIREGSGARNLDSLMPLLKEFPEQVMFCSDDLHPDDLMKGHINLLVKRAIQAGYDLFSVVRAAGYHAIQHYHLDVGLLREGDSADFILVNNLKEWNVLNTYIRGVCYAGEGEKEIVSPLFDSPNRFVTEEKTINDFSVQPEGEFIKVIKAIDGELITRQVVARARREGNNIVSDVENDILKLVVVNRYALKPPAIGFITGFGLKKGAIASSIAHDSHNIICMGVSDEDILKTVNWIIRNRGGIAANDGKTITGLPLPVAGILTDKSVEEAAALYCKVSEIAKASGSCLKAPFMTLAFMSLLVIPELKLSDRGLFDGNQFGYTSLFTDQH